MIKSFRDKQTKALFDGFLPRRFPADVRPAAQRKLRLVHEARTLNDLRNPPGNRLEALQGDRAGQHSIRINDQWRVCFTWAIDGADAVEVADYH